jgi:hypothetical protein
MRRYSEAFDTGERRVLERVAAGAPLPQLLGDVVRFIEDQATGMLCSIVLLDTRACRATM